MGNWYTNICVSGAPQSDVIAPLNELGRRAYVTAETGGWIILYDQECDKFDLDVLESLAMTFSGWVSTKMESLRPATLPTVSSLRTPPRFRQSKKWLPCSVKSSRSLKEVRRCGTYSAGLMAFSGCSQLFPGFVSLICSRSGATVNSPMPSEFHPALLALVLNTWIVEKRRRT